MRSAEFNPRHRFRQSPVDGHLQGYRIENAFSRHFVFGVGDGDREVLALVQIVCRKTGRA